MSSTQTSYVELNILNDRFYLHSIYPVNWSSFISDAIKFNSVEETRSIMNKRYSQISQSLDDNLQAINSIKIVTLEDGNIIGEEYYIRRE